MSISSLSLSVLLLLLGPYNANVHLCWVCVILSDKSFFGFFFFGCFDWVSPAALSLSSWILTSASSLLLNLQCVFDLLIVFFSSVTICYFLVFFLYLCQSSHCVHPFFSPSLVTSLRLLLWTHQVVNRFIKVLSWGFNHLECILPFLHFPWDSVLVRVH